MASGEDDEYRNKSVGVKLYGSCGDQETAITVKRYPDLAVYEENQKVRAGPPILSKVMAGKRTPHRWSTKPN